MSKLDSFLGLVADWKKGDLDSVSARLHPDVVWHFSATTKPPAHGRDGAIAFLKAYGEVCVTSRLRLFSHAENETQLFYEATEDFDTPAGRHVLVPYAGIVDFDADGLITGWRDYFDRALIDDQVAGERTLPDFCEDLVKRPSL